MKTITVSPRSRVLHELLEQAEHENLILRTGDGREFVLAEVDGFDREIELTRQNEELMRFLDRRGREEATITLEEARRRLGISQHRG